jgi:Ca-activated chloride channel family protein
VLFNTDGFVGDEFAILSSVQKHRGGTRMFTFGIGNSVNRFLIDALAAEGRGDAEFVTLATDADEAVQRFQGGIQSPVLTDIEVRFEGLQMADWTPGAISDVFSEKPVTLLGRHLAPGGGRMIATGKLGGEAWSEVHEPVFPAADQDRSAIAALWARKMVSQIMRSDLMATHGALAQSDGGFRRESQAELQITEIGLRYGIMTQCTSFVAVEKRVVNVGGRQVRVRVPVEMTDGVSYGRVFGDRDKAAYRFPLTPEDGKLPAALKDGEVQSLGLA